MADRDLAERVVEPEHLRGVARRHHDEVLRAQPIGPVVVTPLLGEAQLVEHVRTAAHRPIRCDRDGDAGVERGRDVGGHAVQRHVRLRRPDQLHAGGRHRREVRRGERDAVGDRGLGRVQAVRRRRDRAELRELARGLRVIAFADVDEVRVGLAAREVRAHASTDSDGGNSALVWILSWPSPFCAASTERASEPKHAAVVPGEADDARRAGDHALELAPLVDLAAQAASRRAVRRLRAPRGLALRVVDDALLDVEHRHVLQLGRPLIVILIDLRRSPSRRCRRRRTGCGCGCRSGRAR